MTSGYHDCAIRLADGQLSKAKDAPIELLSKNILRREHQNAILEAPLQLPGTCTFVAFRDSFLSTLCVLKRQGSG